MAIHIGVDEVGRGCLFGPVVVAAVILDDSNQSVMMGQIKDSKKLSSKKIEVLGKFIKENALDYAISMIDNVVIDDINILQATFKAMNECITQLKDKYKNAKFLIDGNRFFPNSINKHVKYETVVKGDNIHVCISAASILAKFTRDNYIIDLCKTNQDYKSYDLSNNKGYGTKKHIEALKLKGLTTLHRKTFCKFMQSQDEISQNVD